MISAIDTNILLDVITKDPAHGHASRELLRRAVNHDALVVCEVVYAEIAPQFESRSELDEVLNKLDIRLCDAGPEVAFLAGHRWAEYRRSGGTRARLLADFLIGAHAQLKADRLLTRDRGFYRTYFPELGLLDG